MLLIYALLIIVILGGLYIYNFNKLISTRQLVTQSWSDIDVQLKRRHDLIPNLVALVKQYATYEQNLLEQITQTRSKAMALEGNDLAAKSSIEKEVGSQVHSLLAVAENYPNLKANEQFLSLQTELTKTEDEIAAARRIYNSNVAQYNSLIGVFPINMIASLNHFSLSTYFQND